jgi:hypothetical protein
VHRNRQYNYKQKRYGPERVSSLCSIYHRPPQCSRPIRGFGILSIGFYRRLLGVSPPCIHYSHASENKKSGIDALALPTVCGMTVIISEYGNGSTVLKNLVHNLCTEANPGPTKAPK